MFLVPLTPLFLPEGLHLETGISGDLYCTYCGGQSRTLYQTYTPLVLPTSAHGRTCTAHRANMRARVLEFDGNDPAVMVQDLVHLNPAMRAPIYAEVTGTPLDPESARFVDTYSISPILRSAFLINPTVGSIFAIHCQARLHATDEGILQQGAPHVSCVEHSPRAMPLRQWRHFVLRNGLLYTNGSVYPYFPPSVPVVDAVVPVVGQIPGLSVPRTWEYVTSTSGTTYSFGAQ
mgnify:CR=1 FL=1